MDRKNFLRSDALGFGGISLVSCGIKTVTTGDDAPVSCEVSPTETDGPFPHKTPASYVKENIIGDREGVPLRINLTIQNVANNCLPLSDVLVDIWQCDSKGNYSEYPNQLEGNFTKHHFLRGRQKTNNKGEVSFISIYPGWYPGRAPHLHLEVLDEQEKSLLITQLAFPEKISQSVYQLNVYKGIYDTNNATDFEFRDSLEHNMADAVEGNNIDGYILSKIININI